MRVWGWGEGFPVADRHVILPTVLTISLLLRKKPKRRQANIRANGYELFCQKRMLPRVTPQKLFEGITVELMQGGQGSPAQAFTGHAVKLVDVIRTACERLFQ